MAKDRTQDRHRRSVYFPPEMWAELRAEAKRQDRKVSWLVQRAWRKARDEIRQMEKKSSDVEP